MKLGTLYDGGLPQRGRGFTPKVCNNHREMRTKQAKEEILPPIKHLKIVYWPISKLRAYERNPRKNDAAVDRMCASIREFGFAVPVLARSSGEVVDGHLRLKAAKKLGMGEVPVIVCDGWTEAQVKAFRLMVNRSVAWADWDTDMLGAELIELKGLGFDLGLTGFDVGEIGRLTLQADPAEDEVPPVPETPVTKLGDLWLLGEHRVLCGDCLDIGNVAALLGGQKTPWLLITDPPYGVELDMEWRDRAGHNEMGPVAKSYMKIAMAGKGISGDTRADWSQAFSLVPTLEVAYVWHATSHLVEVAVGLKAIGFDVRQQIIWQKTVAAMGRQAYHWKHEPCWYAVRKGRTARWVGDHTQSTVWDAASPKHIMSGSKEDKLPHPTQKPIVLMKRPMLNHGQPGDVVYEPFGGSGTTLAAAEVTERICYSMEIEPRYCDVIVLRWEKLTGKLATLEATSQTFEQVRDGRRQEWADALHEEAIA